MIHIELQIALIAAAAALLGSLIPQVFSFFTHKEKYKDEMRKEYKQYKLEAYRELSRLIIEISTDENKMFDKEIWTNASSNKLENFKVSNGLLLENDEMIILIDIQQ